MFKKTIALVTSTGLAIVLGVANAAPQELSTEQMDSVNAGWISFSVANADALAIGLNTFSATGTTTITAPLVSGSSSSSTAISNW